MTTAPQGAGRAPITASGSHRITRTGADWITPPAPQTAWQRDRARGALLPMQVHPDAEPWWVSLLLWIGVLATAVAIPVLLALLKAAVW